jgi:D-sedoheptulose 7-phosphate isomerase
MSTSESSYPIVTNWIKSYIQQQTAALTAIKHAEVAKLIHIFFMAWQADRQIFVIGNGGSAANASHFATDLGKGTATKLARRFRVHSLTDNVPWITAIGNDFSFNRIFVDQLQNLAREGDLLVAISVSGASGNLIGTVQWANANNMETIALVGKGGQGQLGYEAKNKIMINEDHYGRAEDVQMTILHMIAYAFKELEIG